MRRTPVDSPVEEQEPVYPSCNGGLYNRHALSDTYWNGGVGLREGRKGAGRRQGRGKPPGPPPDVVSQPVYARVGPPPPNTNHTWRGGSPQLSSFSPHKQLYHASTRSEPGT